MTGHAPARRTPPRRVVIVDRVVVTGVPAGGLNPSTVSASLSVALPSLIARQLGGGALPPGRRDVAAVRLAWSPSAGSEALSRALADGIADALRDGSHE
jgi:hypothetical protein